MQRRYPIARVSRRAPGAKQPRALGYVRRSDGGTDELLIANGRTANRSADRLRAVGPRAVDRSAVAWLSILAALQLLWGAHYVYRTSFEHRGVRVFSLWDDAMISMQYARNLRLGEGLVWNAGGERVQGFTNPGVTLAMAALHWLPLAPTRTALAFQVLCLAVLVATLVGVWGLARRLVPDEPAVASAAALSTLLCAPLAIWSLQGSDVGFSALWLVASAHALAAPRRSTAGLLAVLGAGLWIRPDQALFYLAFIAVLLERGDARTARLAAGLGLATLALQVGASQLYYGDPLPNTYYLKATGSPRLLVLLSGGSRLLWSLPQLAPALALAFVALRPRPRQPVALLCAGVFLLAEAYNTWVGGDFIYGWGSRFVVPALPLLLLLAAMGVRRLLGRFAPALRTETASGVAAACLAMALVTLIANPLQTTREWLDPRAPTMHRDSNRNNYRFAAYLRDHTDPSLSIGAHWGGVPVYFSGRPAIDVLGKSDRHIARLEVNRFFPGHSKWDWDYVMQVRQPDVIRAPSRGLGARADFRGAYVKVETGQGVSFFLRRDALPKLFDDDAVFVDQVTGVRTRRAPARDGD